MRILRSLLALLFFTTTQLIPANASEGYLVIGIDVSGSMRGEALQSTVTAAEQIVESLASARTIEIYTFTRSPKKLDYPSSLSSVASGGYTALFDSIWSLTLRAGELDAPLIILTDGKDSRSLITADELVGRLANYSNRINFVAYSPLPENEEVLRAIATKTGGTVYGVSQSNQLIDTFKLAVDDVVDLDNRSSSPFLLLVSTLMVLIAFLFIRLIMQWREKERFLDSWSDVLENYKFRSEPLNEPGEKNESALLTRIIGDTSLIVPGIKGKIRRETLALFLVIGLIALLLFLDLSILVAIPTSLLLCILFLRAWIKNAESKARLRFESELPASLRLLASSLTAGLSFLQALDSFSSEGNSEVALEFRRALSEIQLGSPIERALHDVAERMQSEDLKWVVFAFSVQREVGGGLAKILQSSAEAIDARANLRQEIRTLSAEGRISSYILILLPPGIFLFLFATRRDFISLFWEETFGQVLLLVVLALMATAWLWIRRLVNSPA